jgi:glycosyltransferase involved in cell wall biosynthesis
MESRNHDNLVSIVIPCFNNEAFVGAAIDSALNQTYPQIEIIVIDDGSKDSSLDLIRAFGDRVRWETGQNQGAPRARNQGIEIASGKYIKFLDADDILLPDCIEIQIAQAMALTSDRQAIVYGDAVRIDREGNLLPSYLFQPRQPDADPIAYILANCPLTSCPLHQKSYLEAIGGFDPHLTRGQEHDLHLRLVLSGVNFVYSPHPIYQYREHPDPARISNQAYSKKSALVHHQAIENHIKLIEQSTSKPLTAQVSNILAQRLWRYGRGILREGSTKEAQIYFDSARNLDRQNCVVGQSPYPIFVRLFGPHYAEKLFSYLKNIVSPSSV